AYHNFQDPSPARLALQNNQFVGFTEVAEFFDHTGPLLVAGNDSEQLDGVGVFHTAFDDNTCCSALTITAPHVFSHNTFSGYGGPGTLLGSPTAPFAPVSLLTKTFIPTTTTRPPAMRGGAYAPGGQVPVTAVRTILHLTAVIIALQGH